MGVEKKVEAEIKVKVNDGVKGAGLGPVCGNGNVHRLLGLTDHPLNWESWTRPLDRLIGLTSDGLP